MSQSKTKEILKGIDRETLEELAFAAIAAIRLISKGEMNPPPASIDRTGICIGLLRGVYEVKSKKATKPQQTPPEPVFNDEVSDVSEATSILADIAKKAASNQDNEGSEQ